MKIISRNVGVVLVLGTLTVGAVCMVNGARRVGGVFPGFLVAKNGIVMSVARANWPLHGKERIFFGKIVAVDGTPVAGGAETDRIVGARPEGTPVTYRLRKGSSIFSETIPVTRFGLADFFSIYASYFAVGACYALAALWVLRRQREPGPPITSFIALCLTISVTLCTGGDVYGPYWFTAPYFIAHALTPCALLHFAASFPQPIAVHSAWRRVWLNALYAGSGAIGLMVVLGLSEPSTFLPLLYTVYLLLANALLLYIARLAVEYGGGSRSDHRKRVIQALSAVILSGTTAGIIFVVYPALDAPISPLALVGPLAFFPLFSAPAVAGIAAPERRIISVRARLSLLLLASVETTFLIGVGLFWVNHSWQLLVDDLTIHEAQVHRVDHFLEEGGTRERLDAVAANVQKVDDYAFVAAAAAALTRGDGEAAMTGMRGLQAYYRAELNRLGERRGRLVAISSALVLAMVGLALLNAAGFMFLIRRWLIRPIERLATATAVIATGNLSYRIQPASTDEFAMLANSIDAMAASLGDIQRKVHLEREARRHAAGMVRDTERRRLARELHDGALQNLTAVKYGLEGELKSRGSSDLPHLLAGATKCITELRSIVDDLRAPDLTEVALGQAIEDHALALTRGRTISLDLEVPTDADVAAWARQDVYRVAQEAISNALRHGAPQHLTVRLFRRGGSMVLEVEDDGRGFDVRTIPPGNGIVGMRERAAVLAADLRIDSGPERGTRIRLDVPLGNGEPEE